MLCVGADQRRGCMPHIQRPDFVWPNVNICQQVLSSDPRKRSLPAAVDSPTQARTGVPITGPGLFRPLRRC
jgi:hypothetical protein